MKLLLTTICLLLLVLEYWCCTCPTLFPHGTQHGDRIVYGENTHELVTPLNTPFVFANSSHDRIYIHRRGAITLGNNAGWFVPISETGCGWEETNEHSIETDAIAVFATTNIKQNCGGTVSYRITQDDADLNKMNAIIKQCSGEASFGASHALIATWNNVSYSDDCNILTMARYQTLLITDEVSTYAATIYDHIGSQLTGVVGVTVATSEKIFKHPLTCLDASVLAGSSNINCAGTYITQVSSHPEIDISSLKRSDLCAYGVCRNGSSCTNTGFGYSCVCAPGTEGKYCDKGVDECAPNPCRSGSCTDGHNSYVCRCRDWTEGDYCQTEKAAYIFIDKVDGEAQHLCVYELSNSTLVCRKTSSNYIQPQTVITMDYSEQLIYQVTYDNFNFYIDVGGEAYRANEAYKATDFSLGGIAYDWVGKNIFYSLTEQGVIQFYNPKTNHVTIIQAGITNPFGVALDIPTGRLFWADGSPAIAYTQVIGSGFSSNFIITNISNPGEIVIDTQERRLYWIDNGLRTISRVDISTNTPQDRQVMVGLLSDARGLAISEDFLFWNDNQGVHIIHKEQGTLVESFATNSVPGSAVYNGGYTQPNISNGCEVNNGGCEQICVPAYQGTHLCMCSFGVLANDTQTCDEGLCSLAPCANDGICIQYGQYYYCHCQEGYTGQNCDVGIPAFAFAHDDEICWNYAYDGQSQNPQCRRGDDTYGYIQILYDVNIDQVYVQGVTFDDDGIYTRSFNWETKYIGPNGFEDTAFKNFYFFDIYNGFITGSYLDWIGKNIFFTDYTNGLLGVYSITSTRWVTILDGLYQPISVAVDIPTGRIFWSEYSANPLRMTYIGNPSINDFVKSGIAGHCFIAIDVTARRLYWIDNGARSISSVDISTDTPQDRRQIISIQANGTSFAISQDYIFWTDTDSAYSVRISDGIIVQTFNLQSEVYHAFFTGSYIQPPIENGCEINNGGCDHMCAPAPSYGYMCLCFHGYLLASDNTTCYTETIQVYGLIVSDMDRHSLYYINTQNGDIHAIQTNDDREKYFPFLFRPDGLAYDKTANVLYFTNSGYNTLFSGYNTLFSNPDDSINKLNWQNPASTQLLYGHVLLNFEDLSRYYSQNPGGVVDGINDIAFDDDSKLLYATDFVFGRIMVLREDGYARTLVHDVFNPWSIALNYQTAEIYWTDVFLPSIEKANKVDGSGRAVVVIGNMFLPHGLTLDVEANKMYWCDSEKIEVADLNGNSRSVVAHISGGRIADMALLGEYLYVTDYYNRTIHKVHKTDGSVSLNEYEQFSLPTALVAITAREMATTDTSTDSAYTTPAIDVCASEPCKNGATCHESDDTYSCECPVGFQGRNCDNDVNECNNNPCLNGGTCKNTHGSFDCYCRDRWAGTTCQTEVTFEPEVYSSYPSVGPAAGGTEITVSGDHLPYENPIVINIGPRVCTTIFKNQTAVIGVTPTVNEMSKLVDVSLTVVVVINGGKILSLPSTFQYKGNPKVKGFYPKETIAKGGTVLTVTGENFESVAEPIMITNVLLFLVLSRDPIVYNETSTIYQTTCVSSTNSKMMCTTPTVDLPDQFITTKRKRRDVINSDMDNNPAVPYENMIKSRTKREIDKYEISSGDDKIEFHVGFRFDGVNDYENFSTIDVYPEPTFEFSTQTETLKFTEGERLAFSGDHLDVGITVPDYIIKVGRGLCGKLELLSNQLSCLPPQQKPQLEESNPGDNPQVIINVGANIQHLVGSLEYPPSSEWVTIIAPVVISGSILIIVLVVVIVVYYRKRKQHEQAKKRTQQIRPTRSQRIGRTTNVHGQAPFPSHRAPVEQLPFESPWGSYPQNYAHAYLSPQNPSTAPVRNKKKPRRDRNERRVNTGNHQTGYIQPVPYYLQMS